MCYSAQVSIDTFLLSLYAAYFIWRQNKLWALGFWMSFTSIQLVEYFLWNNLKSMPINVFWSWVSVVLVCIQPFLSIMSSQIHKKFSIVMAYFLFVACMILHTKNVRTKVGPRGHLLWQWITNYPIWVMIVWSCFLLAPMFFSTNKLSGVFTFFVLLVSWYYYYKDGTWGSMWCWMATMASFYIIFRGIYCP